MIASFLEKKAYARLLKLLFFLGAIPLRGHRDDGLLRGRGHPPDRPLYPPLPRSEGWAHHGRTWNVWLVHCCMVYDDILCFFSGQQNTRWNGPCKGVQRTADTPTTTQSNDTVWHNAVAAIMSWVSSFSADCSELVNAGSRHHGSWTHQSRCSLYKTANYNAKLTNTALLSSRLHHCSTIRYDGGYLRAPKS